MEAQGKTKCVFFKADNPDSCKFGSNCRYSHDIQPSNKEVKKLDKPHYVQQEKKKTDDKEKYQKGNQKEEKPHYEPKYDNGDPETKKKLIYLTNLMESLKQSCKKCVITSCGCQDLCQGCAPKVEKCPNCRSGFLKNLFITGAV